jgi:hypothetical protein
MLAIVDAVCVDCAVVQADLGDDGSAALIVELVHFLLLKALFRDIDASLLSPSSAVDAAWHALILRPVLYSSVCDRLLPADVAAPRLLDHNPAGKTCAQRPMRYRLTHARYLEVFRKAPPEEYWPVGEMSSSGSAGESGTGKRPRHEGPPAAPCQDVTESTLTIFVEVQGGERLTIKARPSTPIYKLHYAIKMMKDIPVVNQRLMVDGRTMDSHRTLSNYDIMDEDTLSLVIQQVGC